MLKALCFRVLAGVILSATICGCIPAYYTYWAPYAQGGRLFKSAADGSIIIAPSDTIEFSFDGLRIQLGGNGTELGMSLHIPKGRSMSFVSDVAEVFEKQPRKRVDKIKFDVSYVDSETLKRVHLSPTSVLTRKLYVADITFGGPEKIQYSIKLPPIIVNGKIYEIPETEFVKKQGFGVGL